MIVYCITFMNLAIQRRVSFQLGNFREINYNDYCNLLVFSSIILSMFIVDFKFKGLIVYFKIMLLTALNLT